MKVKILYEFFTKDLENKINNFIKNKKIISISFNNTDTSSYAYILYEE